MEPKITFLLDRLEQHSVTIRVSDGFFTSEYTCSNLLGIGQVIKSALENFFHQRARREMEDTLKKLSR